MSTTRFNNNILEAARRLKDKRTMPDASDDTGKRYTSAILSIYENRAVRDIVKENFKQLGPKFGTILPEFVKTSDAFVIPTSGLITKAADQWFFLELATSDGLVRFSRIEEDVLKVSGGLDKLVTPTYARPMFYEEGLFAKVRPPTSNGLDNWTAVARYIVVPQDIVVSTISSETGKQ